MKKRIGQLIALIKLYLNFSDMKRTFTLLKPFLYRQRKAYAGMLLLLFTDIFLTIAFAWFFGNMTDAAVRSDFNELRRLVPIGVSLVVLSIVSNFASILIETVTTNGLKKDLKNHLFHHMLRLPLGRVTSQRSGEIMSHFTNDINSVDGVVGSSLIDLIRLPLIYVSVFIYLLNINWKLSLLSVSIAPLAVVAGAFFGLLLRNNSRMIHDMYGKINSLLTESLQGFQVIRSFTMEKLIYNKYASQNQKLYDLELANAKLSGWFNSGGQIVTSITYLVSLCLGAYYVTQNIITVGSLLTFVSLVNHLVNPLTGLAGQWAGFQWSVSALERVVDVLESPTESNTLSAYSSLNDEPTSICFSEVSFGYDENNRVFEEFSLHIPSGKMVAIVGPSGAGKSTLLNLLQGFYLPQKGKIYIGGKQTDEFTLSQLRSSIANVPQETFLFAGTIKENLRLALPNLSDEQIITATKKAEIYDFIASLPDGFETEIGERGIKLSGGQKQRMAIARAILKDAPILLLDEATSALDSETEYYVKIALESLMKDRTTIVIAHRLSTIQHADIIVVMDQGKVTQIGSHEELLNKEGLYKRLHDLQFFEKKEKIVALNA
ncbi:ABC transporter ATP-binding protein/permease [Rossellomorea vietnamensis]|uniref:ABC transporter ATP-binding protein/permease n=1 Tax=Rossellomorea vietnamensis TaxID=218284 RepID=A0ACD4C2B1_9BACI|nr:ABC transporter ATP-binding protein [Rossellomorea vietnamensis]UXH42738.1 ABC transporter ATP-binding protein/permease [Rossellomorea vietnamensis]